MTQVKVIKQGFNELASSVLIGKIEQENLWHLKQPVRNNFVQKTTKSLIKQFSTFFVGWVRCLVKAQQLIKYLKSLPHHQLYRVEQVIHHNRNLVRCKALTSQLWQLIASLR